MKVAVCTTSVHFYRDHTPSYLWVLHPLLHQGLPGMAVGDEAVEAVLLHEGL